MLGGLWVATAGSGRGGGAMPTATGPGAEALFPAAPLAVKVERPNAGFVLRREGGLWSQVSPAWFPLSAEAGQEVARVLAGAVVREKHLPGEAGATLAEASLEEAVGEVEVVASAGVTRVLLGESTPGGRSYALVEESPEPGLAGRIVSLPEGLHRFAFSRRDGGWYERVLPLPPLDAVVAMRLAGGGEAAVSLARDAGRWILDDDGARLRPEVAERMRGLPGALLVREFLSPTAASAGPAAFGLRSPSAVWELEEASRRTTRLRLGRGGGLGDDGVYAELERLEGDTTLTSPILKLPPVVLFLGRGREALADPRVFPFEPGEARVLELRTAEREDPVAVVRSEPDAGPAWQTPPPEAFGLPAAELLDAVLALTGERRLLPPDRGGRLGIGGTVDPDEAAGRPRPPGYAGTIALEHGLTGRSEAEVFLRRRHWFLRFASDPFEVEYALDEASEARLEADVLPLLRGPLPGVGSR